MTKPKVAFICVHNACRSQIADSRAESQAMHVKKPLRHGLFSKKSLRYWEGVLPSVFLNTLVKTR